MTPDGLSGCRIGMARGQAEVPPEGAEQLQVTGKVERAGEGPKVKRERSLQNSRSRTSAGAGR